MNKKLRFSFMAALLALCGAVSAQDVIWEEDWSSATEFKVDPSGFNSNYTFTGTTFNDDGSYKGGTAIYDENLAGGDAPELLVAKGGGTFTATVSLGGRSGSTTLTWRSNKNLTITINSSSGTEIITGNGDKTGNDYSLAFDIPSGTSGLEIVFTNGLSTNGRLDDIKLYQGVGKLPAGLSWGTSSRTVRLGAEDNSFPTLSNVNELQVDYYSDNTSVATIDQSTGDITLIAVGKTNIFASYPGDDTYDAQTVSYELTVKEAQDLTQYTVTQALAIIDELEDGATTSNDYYVKGTVTQITEISTENGNATFYISDGSNQLYAFRLKGLQRNNITDNEYLKVNDEVVLFGKLQKYKKNDEITPEIKSGYIYELNGKTEDEGSGEQTEELKTVTVAQFIEAEVSSNVWYQLTGTIKNLAEGDQYGNFDLQDATGSVYVYGVLSEKGGDKKKFQELVEQYGIKNGSVITIIGKRGYYAAQDKIEVVEAYFVSVDNSGAIDPQTYEVNVAEALTKAGELEEGAESIDTYIVSGYIVGDPVAERKEDDGTLYGNFNFVIADEQNGTNQLTIYHCRGKNNEAITEETEHMIKANDFVKLQGKLKKFVKDGVTTLELVKCYILDITPANNILGDVNKDGNVNSADVQKTYSLMAQGANGETNPEADINNDGFVNSADIQKIYGIMATGK